MMRSQAMVVMMICVKKHGLKSCGSESREPLRNPTLKFIWHKIPSTVFKLLLMLGPSLRLRSNGKIQLLSGVLLTEIIIQVNSLQAPQT